MRRVSYALGFCLGVVALACSSSAADTTTIVRPELISVSPDDFLGRQSCTDADDGGDAVQSYVATLFDVTPSADGTTPNPGLQLPSSPPTSCLLPVTFSLVVTGHLYLAEVDAYDRPPTDIAPSTPGARIQFDKGKRVLPRWVATCGGYPQTVVADGGTYLSVGGAPTAAELAAGAGGEGNLSGVVSYEALTETAHNCRGGLRPVEN